MQPTRRLAILVFDDAEVLDFCGPFEVFSIANEPSGGPGFDVFTVAEKCPVMARNGLSVNPDYDLGNCPRPDILLVPGGLGTRQQVHNAPLVDWIRRIAEDAELVLSVCTGALLLGKAGLLDGLDITTHHTAYDLLREMVPAGTVHEHRRFVDTGRVVTSAGIAAGIDMSLHVVARLLGPAAATGTARRMEYPWPTDSPEAFVVAAQDPRSQEAEALIVELSQELADRYDHADDGTGDFRPEDRQAASTFLVGRWYGQPVACGALRPLSGNIVEVKRMFVRAPFRGRGLAKRMLTALEATARELGYGVVRLETGDRQPEAIALYERADYRRIDAYGIYVNSLRSVCFEKQL